MTTGTVVVGSPQSGYYYQKTFSGNNDPQHKKWNPYQMTVNESSKSLGTLNFAPNYPPQYFIDCGNYNLTPVWSDNDEVKLLNKIVVAARGHSFHLGKFLIQGNELVNQIRGTSMALGNAYSALRRGRPDQAIRSILRILHGESSPEFWTSSAKKYGVVGSVRYARNRAQSALNRNDLASAWLALRYGWMPLISDLYNSGVAYSTLTSPARKSRFVVSLGTVDTHNSSTSPGLWTCTATKNSSSRIIVEMTEELSVARSLGLLDPLGVVWEKLPYSFVVDWFYPLSDYFEALAIIPNLKASILRTDRVKVEAVFNGTTEIGNYIVGGGDYRRSTSLIRRPASSAASVSIPLPSFVGLQGLTDHSTRVANAIALLSNIFKHK